MASMKGLMMIKYKLHSQLKKKSIQYQSTKMALLIMNIKNLLHYLYDVVFKFFKMIIKKQDKN